MAARNVKLIDYFPPELRSDHNSQLSYDLNDLPPGSSQTVIIHAMANHRGDFCNMAKVTSENHEIVDDLACTTVYEPMVQINKTGTKTARLGEHANYVLHVSNPGDVALSNVTVTDTAPSGTRIVSAEGASI